MRTFTYSFILFLVLFFCNQIAAQPCSVTINPAQPELSCQDTVVVLTANAFGGSAPYTYTWSDGVSSMFNFVSSSGVYCVTITDGNGCTASNCVTVTAEPDIPPSPFPCNAPFFCESPFSSLCGNVYQSQSTTGSCLGFYNQWIQFTADDPFLSLQLFNNGFINPNTYISAQVFLPGDNCEEILTFTPVTDCFFISILTGYMTIEANDLVPGQTYYLAIGSSDPNTGYILNGLGFGNPIPPTIVPAYDCAQDSLGGGTSDCSRVCENSTMTYTLQPPSIGGISTWNVTGAESYSFDGNVLTVQWGAAGTGNIFTTSTGLCGGGTAFLCVDIVANAEAVIATVPQAVNNTLTVCNGQAVYFSSESLNADAISWDFGDLNTSNEVQPIHIYNVPGTYEVTLIARNSCFCSDTAHLTVVVQNALTPEIGCKGTICEGETVTYTTDANCSTFNWSVSPNGTIVSGGGVADNSITIQWNSGPLGTITLDVGGCSGLFCSEPAVAFIPIISENVQIEGPEHVCANERATYTIPPYQGVSVFWTVVGGGYIADGQGTSSIEVSWFGGINPGIPNYVIVQIDNCYLDCSGKDSLAVYIVDEFYTAGPVESCADDMATYTTHQATNGAGVSCNWSLTDPAGVIAWTSAAAATTANVPFLNGPGRYDLEAVPATPGLVCNEFYNIAINVVDNPPPVGGINGETTICPGNWYTYEATGGSSGNLYHWEIHNGAATTLQTGNPVNVQWSAGGPYSLSVVQVNGSGLPCESTPVSLNINALTAFTINGDNDLCLEEVGAYSTQSFEKVDYVWSILPADAGTITSGQNTDAINVFWHSSGNHTVRLNICGLIQDFAVQVRALPVPVIVAPGAICAGDVATVQTAAAYTSYNWQDAGGSTISVFPTISLAGGDYLVSVTDAFGCTGAADFHITEYPLPEAFISTPDNLFICNNIPAVHFYANDDATGLSYQWYKDGVPTWIDSPTLTNGQYSTFHVDITDANGCTATSNSLTIVESCGGGGGVCNNPGHPASNCVNGVDITFAWAFTPTCETIQFNNTSPNYMPGTGQWNFDDLGSGAANISTLENPTHSYSKAGFYTVIFEGQTTLGQLCWMYAPVEVRAVADFFNETNCIGLPMTFEDRTTFLPTVSLAGWSWDFGDPASGAANTTAAQDPTHIYNTPGNYTVTLVVTTSGGCTTTFSKQVTVEPPPSVTFTPPVQNCEDAALPFSAIVSPDAFELSWDFGNPASGAANTSEVSDPFHAFNTAGNYNVELTVSSVYGCSNTHTEVVAIAPNPLGGVISAVPDPPICEGTSTTLSAPGGGTGYNWSSGEITASVISSEESVYEVTITNNQGCSYTTPPFPVEVVPQPTGTIRAIEYNEFGQPVNFDYDGITICEGEDVFLEIISAGTYINAWSTGESGNAIEFSEDRGNQLSVGIYNITVNITDLISGCSQQEGPFTIVVNALPDPIYTASVPSGITCEGSPVTFSVTNPQAGVNYQWNTGETGTSTTASFAGAYYAVGTNQFGCKRESDSLFILELPDIARVPGGCHVRCEPDTLCLPAMPGIVSMQWLLNGTPIPAPNGTIPNLVATQSGVYELVMTDIYGCTATSDPLNLELYQGYGTFTGDVYFDINDNGIIDATDTLMSGIDIVLIESGTNQDTVTSDVNGNYGFANILSTDYTLLLDPTTLPPNVVPYYNNVDTSLVGCDDMAPVDWLVHFQCITVDFPLPLTVCANDSLVYNGQVYYAGDTEDITYVLPGGCDSIVHLTVTGIPVASATANLDACNGDSISYLGYVIYPGESQVINLSSVTGCDSLLTVNVAGLPVNTSSLNLEVCPGEQVTYNGQQLDAGETVEVILMNQYGCDSTVTVSVTAYPDFSFEASGSVSCWNNPDGAITISNVQPAGAAYSYSLDNIQFQTATVFDSVEAGNYTVYVADENSCVNEVPVIVTENPPIQLSFQNTTLPCASDFLTLTPTVVSHPLDELDFLWQDSAEVINFNVYAPGTYQLQVSSACETLLQSVAVAAEDDTERSYVFIPNVFSPNHDGINDVFRAFFANEASVDDFLLRVYDRWGNMIYETTDYQSGWEGPFRDKAMDSAVFAYYIKASVFACHEPLEIFKYGDVTVVK